MIALEAVTKSFPVGNGALTVLRKVSLVLHAGEHVAVVGASGSGKSTLLSIMAGLDRPSSGTVSLAGLPLNDLDESRLAAHRREHVGFVFQAFHLVPSLTLLENTVLPGAFRNGRIETERASELLDAVGLSHRRDFLPARVSGGEQQRAAIARALVNDPAIVFADEPTGNLDTTGGRAVMDLLEEQTVKQGRALVVVTHDPGIAARANRVIRLADGQIVSDGPPSSAS